MLKITLSKLNNNQLYTLGLRTKEILSTFPIDEMEITKFYKNFIENFSKYEGAKEKLKIREEIVKGKDRVRDKYFNHMVDHFENYLDYPDAEIQEQVKSLLNEINNHGPNIAKRRYNDETAILQNIIAKINAVFTELVEKTHNVWFQLMAEAQADFEKTVHDLTKKKAEKSEIESPTNIRPELEEAIRKLITFLPMQYELTNNEKLGEAIDLLAVEFKRF